jgi:hypothetical protein
VVGVRVWGERSLAVYATLDPRLQKYCDKALQEVADISLTCGHRGQREQNEKFYSNNSKVQWPNSKHNSLPSLAVDLQPYPYPRNDLKLHAALGYIAGRIIQMAAEDGVTIRWGGDWDKDGDVTDQSFDDLFHLEIIE